MSIFTKVKMAMTPSSTFNLDHDIKLSFDMGQLIPTTVMDVVPGDKIKISPTTMLRFQPLISPVMHRVKVKTDYFFVPNRLMWSDWETFITGETEVEPPYIDGLSGIGTKDLGDYLGYPTGGVANVSYKASAFPVAAYALIYDEYYRDQNLITEISTPLVNGLNSDMKALAQGPPQIRAWMHDYFTSCLPFAQKGDAVKIPLLNEDAVPVKFITGLGNQAPQQILRDSTDDSVVVTADLGTTTGGILADLSGAPNASRLDITDTHEVNINNEATTIETLRKAFRLQEWLEKNARGGTRYIEFIKAHFGVSSKDSRLQRPEYIGGSKQNMVISEVLASAQTDPSGSQEYPIGTMGGHGISMGGGNSFSYSATEHGWIMGILSVVPDTAYQQGLPKMFKRESYLDYYFPSFANLGEQEVLNSELYIGTETPTKLDQTFGYIPRYAEYKYINNRVAGDLKGNLAFWHLGRIFDSSPTLNQEFIDCIPDKRIFAVEDENENAVIGHIFIKVSAKRKMPKYGTPTL